MPLISSFYGISVYIYYIDRKRHYRPHIHVKYGEFKAGVAIDNGEILYGDLPLSKMKLVQAWIEIHHEELMENWELAVNGQKPFKIQPLK